MSEGRSAIAGDIHQENYVTIKTAVIGVGSMGRNHARIYSELTESQLVAVCDTNPILVTEVAERYNAEAFTDYRHMLTAFKPEAVSVVTPTALHSSVTMGCLEAGAHVLVEKPISANISDGQQMIKMAERCHRILMVGHVVRFNPAIQQLKQRLLNGDLGRIYQIVCRRVGPFPARIRDVGVVIDLASHDLDLMRYLTEMEPIRVFAETEQRIHTDHEDLILALLRFPDGLSGSLEVNWLTPTKVREVLVLGERGMFRVDDLTQDLYFYENAAAGEAFWPALQTLRGVSEGCMTRFGVQRYEPLKAELKAFLNSIQKNEPPPVSGEDGLEALRLALALVESGHTNRVIQVADNVS